MDALNHENFSPQKFNTQIIHPSKISTYTIVCDQLGGFLASPMEGVAMCENVRKSRLEVSFQFLNYIAVGLTCRTVWAH